MNRRRVAIASAIALVVAGLAAVVTWQLWPDSCVDRVVAGEDISAPFDESATDLRLDRLVDAADGWGVGRVSALVGYDYDRFIDFAALSRGFAVWRKGDPVMTVIDSDGTPQWGIRQAKVRHTWDASAERFVMIAAPKDGPAEVAAHAMASGATTWCVRLDQEPLSATDPIATSVNTANDVLVLAGSPSDLRLTKLAASDGSVKWTKHLKGIDRGGYVSGAFDGVVVVGGRPAHELGDPPAAEASVLAGIDESDGSVRWRYEVPAATTATVVGDSDGQVVVRESGPQGQHLVMLDQESGAVQWQRANPDPNADLAVRGRMLLQRTATSLSGRELGTGRVVWTQPVRRVPQQFPYGFQLAQQPMVDAGHVLLAGTDALVSVRLADGRRTRWELPTDGVSTTYWPYRIALSGPVLAVATNTGAVLVGPG